MPALSTLSGATVLVTGGTGYVGATVVKDILQQGALVRCAVRSEEKDQELVKHFSEFSPRVSYAVVPVIEAPGAFNEAVKDVDAIVHVASPVIFALGDPQGKTIVFKVYVSGHNITVKTFPAEIIRPAVEGTTGILKSAHQFGTKVQRVVITGSTAAVGRHGMEPGGPITHDETTYYEEVVARVNEKGAEANPGDKYCASKTLSDKAAWEWMASNKPAFDITIVLPSVVLGPWDSIIPSKDKVPSTIGYFTGAINPPGFTDEVAQSRAMSFIDVRDVARVHSLALLTPEAGGQRVLVSSDHFSWQDAYDILHKTYPDSSIPRGTPYTSDAARAPGNVTYNTTKLFKLFPDLKLKTFEEVIVDMAKAFEVRGWLF